MSKFRRGGLVRNEHASHVNVPVMLSPGCSYRWPDVRHPDWDVIIGQQSWPTPFPPR